MTTRWGLLLGALVLAGAACAARPAARDTLIIPQTPLAGDTSAVPAPAREAPPGYEPTKSPVLAMTLSAVLPGAGQVYNESYWKVPVVLGFAGYFMYEIIHNNNLYKDYGEQYQESLETTPGGQGDQQLLALREFYRDERDRFGWYFLITYALNILDAYVDASLYDFDVGEDLSLQLRPGVLGLPTPVPSLTIRMQF